jgi:hypothetical protein
MAIIILIGIVILFINITYGHFHFFVASDTHGVYLHQEDREIQRRV